MPKRDDAASPGLGDLSVLDIMPHSMITMFYECPRQGVFGDFICRLVTYKVFDKMGYLTANPYFEYGFVATV